MSYKNCYKSFLAVSALAVIFINAQPIMLSVKNALLICYNNIIPSLYVFMVFSSYISQSDFINLLYYPFSLYSRLMKIEDKKFSAYLLLSLIGGFAVGAVFLNELEKSGYEKNCIISVAPAMINNSLSFCVFAVGAGMLGNIYIGIMLFCAVTCSSLITSFILSFIFRYNIVLPDSSAAANKKSFTECVNSSVRSILSICGFVVIFYSLCEVLSLYIDSHFLNTAVTACLEVTSGCLKILEISGNNPYLLCIALSLLPVSTLCQVYYFTGSSEIIKSLVFSRLIHIPLSLVIFTVLVNLFPVSAGAVTPDVIAVKAYSNSIEISATLFMITLCFILIFDRNKLFTKHNN